MGNTTTAKRGWKQKLKREMVEYFFIVLYLAIFFGVFTNYRRLILAQYSISYGEYGMSIIEAMIMGKVVLILDGLKVGRKSETRPLIYSTLTKSVLFTIGAVIFKLGETTVRGYLKDKGLSGVREEFAAIHRDEMLANGLVVFCAFCPYFAVRDMGRVLGRQTMLRMFFVDGRARRAEGADGE